MSFQDFYHQVFWKEEKVKNAPNSPSYSGSLIKDWEIFKGRTAQKCARCGKALTEDDKVGGHVLKVPSNSIDYYVLPLCKDCNHPSVKQPYYVPTRDLVRLIDIKREK